MQFFADLTPANTTNTNRACTFTINNTNDYAESSAVITGARINSAGSSGYLTVDSSYDLPSIWVFAASDANPDVHSSLEIAVESYSVPSADEEN